MPTASNPYHSILQIGEYGGPGLKLFWDNIEKYVLNKELQTQEVLDPFSSVQTLLANTLVELTGNTGFELEFNFGLELGDTNEHNYNTWPTREELHNMSLREGIIGVGPATTASSPEASLHDDDDDDDDDDFAPSSPEAGSSGGLAHSDDNYDRTLNTIY